MESKFEFAANGQEIQQGDFEGIADNAALADDRALWEFFRTREGSPTPEKFIITYGTTTWKDPGDTVIDSNALVVGGKADGSVRVLPFRAVVGSRTLASSNAKESLRGMRSAYAVGTTTLHRTVLVGANATGNPRWVLIYATISPDATGDTETRYKKDPTSGVVSSSSVTINTKTNVTVSALNGTAAGSPTRPAVPSDSLGQYNIALAYIWVPNGHGVGSTIDRKQIHEVAPCLTINSALGVRSIRPASGNYVDGGAVMTNQNADWSSTPTRPGAYLPGTMVGGEERLILIQGGVSPDSHVDGDVIDNSIDWRYRYFFWEAAVTSGTTAAARFPSDPQKTGTGATAGSAFASVVGTSRATGFGQSFYDDSANGVSVASCQGVAVYFSPTEIANMGAETCELYVRSTDGALMYKKSGNTTPQILIRLQATGPFSNYGTL